MSSVEEEKPETIVLKKILVEKRLHVDERVSPKETVLDIQTVEPPEFKISLETADGKLKPEGDEQEKVALKYFILAPEEKEPEVTPIVSRKTTLTGEKIEVAIDHITYAKDEPPLPDEELKFISIVSEHAERDSGEEKGHEIKLIVHREGAVEKVSDKFSVLHEGEIPVHEKEEEIESTYVPKHIPREPYEPRDPKRLLGKERKSKISLQPEEFPIKDKTSFVKDITEAGIDEIPLLRSGEEKGGFTLEKSEVPPGGSMKEHGIQNKTQWMKKSGTTVAEIPIDKILNKEAKKMEIIQDDEKDENLDFTSAELHYLDTSEETEPALRKDVDLEHPTEDKEVPREKPYIMFKPSVLKTEVVERKTREKYSAEEGEVHYEEGSGQLLTEKTLLSDKTTGKKNIPEKEDKTTFSTHSKKDKIRQSNAPEKLPVEKEEFDTLITGEGMEGEVSIGEHEKGVKDERVDRSESVKKIPVRPPGIQDKKIFQEVHTIQDEHKETPALKSSKDKTREKKSSLTVEEMKLSGKELPVTEGTSDEKTSDKHGIGKSTSVTMKKEKGKFSDKIPSSKGITANGEVSYSSSIGKTITPKKAEGEKEYWKSEPAHMIEQSSRLSSENRNLDPPGESREVLDVPAKSHAKRGEEDCCQILPQSACTICFRRIPFAIVMFVFIL
nr:PREDICTED: titin-like [Pelecanus crispus]